MIKVLISGLAMLVFTFSLMTSAHANEDDLYRDAMIAAGYAAFQHRCIACHSMDASKNSFGPSLHGIIGRKAGSLPRYAYLKAMKNAGFVWDDNYLRDWIHDNEKFLPGTRMRHVSITDITEQDYLLAFIKTLK